MRCSSQTYYSQLMLDNDFWQWNTMRWGFPQCISCTSSHYNLLAQTYTGLLWGTIYVSSHTHIWSTLLSLFYQYKRKIGNSGIRFPFSIPLSWHMLPTIKGHVDHCSHPVAQWRVPFFSLALPALVRLIKYGKIGKECFTKFIPGSNCFSLIGCSLKSH